MQFFRAPLQNPRTSSRNDEQCNQLKKIRFIKASLEIYLRQNFVIKNVNKLYTNNHCC